MAQTKNKTEQLAHEKLRLSGMDCADCAQSIERSLGKMPGVASAQVNFATGAADVRYDPGAVTQAELLRRIDEMGYTAEAAPLSARNTGSGQVEFTIEGMDCADCAATVEKAVAQLAGVRGATVNFGTGRLVLMREQDAGSGLMEAVERTVSEAGYRATLAGKRGAARDEARVPYWKRERRVVTTAAGALAALTAFALSLAHMPAPIVNALYGAAALISGLGFARAGWLAARAGRADMNLLMTVAAVGAAALGDWAEAATVVLLFSFGGTLQAYTLDKTRGAIRSLMDLSPATALVRRALSAGATGTESGVREVRVPVEEVRRGETVLVGPGERLPLDGEVLSGNSAVDQSPITGESVPVDVEPGSEVFAGTINGGGALAIKTLREAGDTTLARIIEMVEDAQARRAPSQHFVDRFSAIYTPIVIAGAVLVMAVPPVLFGQPFTDWFYRALVLLVIACPCALVISTPVSIVAAIGAATRHGVLVKGGATLEQLGRVRAVAFDKTGTLTEGRPRVVSVYAVDGDKEGLLAAAAVVEARSEHPLARAIVHAARTSRGGNGRHGSAVVDSALGTGFMALPGLGAQAPVEGRELLVGNPKLFAERGISLNPVEKALDDMYREGYTAVIVGSEDTGVRGVIALADSPRPEARAAVETLKRAGIRHIVMLTGDNERTAAAIARQVGVDSVSAALLPDGKVEAVRRIEAEHGPTAMLGDGINDAPALSAATVGIAMGAAGTDAALEVADVALMSDDLSRVDYALLLSRKTVQVIKQNVAVSIGVKVLALALAGFGTLPLWAAILADMGVSLLVTLNGMRLLAFRGEQASHRR